MQTIDWEIALDREQLRALTMDDPQLMRDIIAALIEDTSRQIHRMQAAIRDQDRQRCARLAHYSKGACSNCGANAAAAALQRIERQASEGAFEKCRQSLAALVREVERLQQEGCRTSPDSGTGYSIT